MAGDSPGAATGQAVFTADEAAEQGQSGPVILVRMETNPDDIHGMNAAKGILTARGGMTSHAAVVAREFKLPCIVGVEEITKFLKDGNIVEVNAHKGTIKILKG